MPNDAASRFRWAVLGAYMFTGIVSQLLWITFSPILPQAEAAYRASDADIGLLSAIYPLVYVFASIPVGYAIDAFGFRKAVLTGAGLLAVSGVLRAFPSSFVLVLFVQAIGALGQPFVLNSVSKLVRGWFPVREAALATGLGTLSLLIGLVLALGLTPSLLGGVGFTGTLLVYGLISAGAFIVFYFVGRESATRAETTERATVAGVLDVMKARNIVLLSVLFFLGLGVFNAVATWIERMATAKGIGTDLAGPLGGIMIIGGIAGSIVIPGLSDRYHTLKRPLLVSLALSAGLWYLLGILSGFDALALTFFVLGFFFVSALPLGLELSARSVEADAVGVANSIVWEFSQIGGVVLIFIFEGIAASSGWDSLFFVSAVLTLAALVLTWFIRAR